MYFKEAIDITAVKNIISDNDNNPSNLITILQQIQECYGYVPRPAVELTASELNIYPGRVFGVVTFYSQFALVPKGKNIIRVCEGTACHVRGCDAVSARIGKKVGLSGPGTTKDKQFTVEHVACVGACAKAPVITVNDDVYGKVQPDMISSIIDKYL